LIHHQLKVSQGHEISRSGPELMWNVFLHIIEMTLTQYTDCSWCFNVIFAST